MNVVPILPQPVAIIPCPFHEQMKAHVMDEVDTIRSKGGAREFMPELANPNSDELYHLDYYSVLEQQRFERFRYWIEEQAELFVKDVMGKYLSDTMLVTDSWINICDVGGIQGPHYHGNTIVSGVYYANYDNTKHATTYFVKNTSLMQFPDNPTINLASEKNTRYNQIDHIKANEGELLLFPATVVHGYKKNTEANRITVVMNFMPNVVGDGDYGWRVSRLTDEERLRNFTKRKKDEIWVYPDIDMEEYHSD